MTENDKLPLLGEFTDRQGNRWAFDNESICYLETGEGAPFWHLYCYHSLRNPTPERCAEILRVSLAAVEVAGQKAE